MKRRHALVLAGALLAAPEVCAQESELERRVAEHRARVERFFDPLPEACPKESVVGGLLSVPDGREVRRRQAG